MSVLERLRGLAYQVVVGPRTWIPTDLGPIRAPWHLVPGPERLGVSRNVWEIEERRAIDAVLDPALPVVEIGGGLGVVALATSKRLRRPERHVVVDANPVAVRLIEATRRKNQRPFQVRHAAVWYGEDAPRMAGRRMSAAATPGVAGEVVPVTTLTEILDEAGFDRFNLIMDIEGGEYALIRNEWSVIKDRCASMVAEFHAAPDPEAGATFQRLMQLPWSQVHMEWGVIGLAA